MFKATDFTSGMESGAYHARLKDIEEYEGTKHQSDEAQQKFGFVFELLEEGFEGRELQRRGVNAETFGPKSTARAIVEGILGRKIQTGEEITKEDLVGKECDLAVTLDTDDRGTFANIQSVMPVRKKSRQADQAESKQMRDVHDGRAPVAEPPPDTDEDLDDLPFN